MKIYRYEQSEEEVRNAPRPIIFLAGPTVRGNQPHLTSWRFDCIREFERQDFGGSLIVPEFSSKVESDKGKDWIPLWEFNGLKTADCILFWIPRTRELIGLTTNWEHGYWIGREVDKLVYGRPDDAYRIRYLDIMWEAVFKERGIGVPPIHSTLEGTVMAAISKGCKHMRDLVFQTNLPNKFFAVSVVNADIKSKWQANFLQVFPLLSVYEKLPETHETDKAVFQKHWQGDKSVTFEQFNKGQNHETTKDS